MNIQNFMIFMLGPILDEMGQSSALSIYQNQAIQKKQKPIKIAGIVALFTHCYCIDYFTITLYVLVIRLLKTD